LRCKAPRQGKVLFVHAAECFTSRPTQNVLTREGIDRIVKAYRDFADEDRFSRVVPVEEIRENDWNLNISRYIDTLEPEEPVDVAAALVELKRLERERDEAAATMDRLIKELGYDV
jgi:type I restriction enzyme M protein